MRPPNTPWPAAGSQSTVACQSTCAAQHLVIHTWPQEVCLQHHSMIWVCLVQLHVVIAQGTLVTLDSEMMNLSLTISAFHVRQHRYMLGVTDCTIPLISSSVPKAWAPRLAKRILHALGVPPNHMATACLTSVFNAKRN